MSAAVVVLLLIMAVGAITVAILMPLILAKQAVPFKGTAAGGTTSPATTAAATTGATTAGGTTAAPTSSASGVFVVINDGSQLYYGPGTFNEFLPPRFLNANDHVEVLARGVGGFVTFLRIRRCGQAVSSPREEWIEETDVTPSTDPCAPAP